MRDGTIDEEETIVIATGSYYDNRNYTLDKHTALVFYRNNNNGHHRSEMRRKMVINI